MAFLVDPHPTSTSTSNTNTHLKGLKRRRERLVVISPFKVQSSKFKVRSSNTNGIDIIKIVKHGLNQKKSCQPGCLSFHNLMLLHH
jgi:hypothetical protein